MADSVESEVKLVCKDLEALIAAHPDTEWTIDKNRHFEDNLVFELPGDVLAGGGSILRLRVVEGEATLTFKGLVPESATSAIKVREELETRIERPETLAAIFERLGMRRVFRYQKHRTVYRLTAGEGELLAMFDETPMGNFLELEGDAGRVIRAAECLGFRRSDFVVLSYIGMQAAFCRARGVPLEDLVFASPPREESGPQNASTRADVGLRASAVGSQVPDTGSQ
jgi:adenylate cyclase, class 2